MKKWIVALILAAIAIPVKGQWEPKGNSTSNYNKYGWMMKDTLSAQNVYVQGIGSGTGTIGLVYIDPTVVVQEVTIDSAETESGVIDLGSTYRLIGVVTPAEWTAALLSFKGGGADSVVADIYDIWGNELTFNLSATASRYIPAPVGYFSGVRYIVLRSGVSGAGVAQVAARSFKLVLRRY